MKVSDIKSILRERLSDKRYFHSLAVADMSAELASMYGCDTEKAYIAGLVHDIMRETDSAEMQKFVADNDIKLSQLEKASINLWHGKLGAIFVELNLGIDDCDILNAVRHHTTGRADMTLIEKVVFLADCTSRDRDYPGVDNMRKLAKTDLDLGMYEALKFCVNDLTERNIGIHPDTINAFKYFSNICIEN